MPEETAAERVLVITAHPDDVDFGAAGSVAVWTDAGIEVSYCIVTDGDAGGFDPAVARSAIAGIRQAEQIAAAKEVGVHSLTFLGYPDGALEVSLALRKDISRVIRQVRPQRVVTQSPERTYDRIYGSHPDHLASGEAAFCAVYPDSRNPFTFADLVEVEGLAAWTVDEVWTMNGPGEVHFVDITAQIDRKIRALLRHESQHTDTAATQQVVRGWNGENARRAGLSAGSYAEVFGVVNTR